MSRPQQLTVDQALSRAKKAAKKGNAVIALQLYNAVLQHQPNHPVARKAARKLKKELPHNQSVHEQAQNPSQDQINALINLYHSGQMTRVEQTCRELLDSFPQSLIVINVLGISLQALGRVDEAVQVFDRAIQVKPDYAEAYSNRGVALQELGHLEEAVQAFDKAIQLKPEYAEAHGSRGVALHELGQLKEAMVDYDRAIQLKPDYAEVYTNRGAALKELGQLKQAVKAHDIAIQLKPDYADAYSNRGAALQELGQLEEAVVSCDKAILLKFDHEVAYNNRGIALQELGHLSEAIVSYDKAIQLKPDYAEAYYNRGVTLQVQGQMKEAVESYNKAIQLKPDYAKAYYNRGNVHQLAGQLKEARESYDGAIQLKPDYAEAHRTISDIKSYSPDDPQIKLMESLLTDAEPCENDRTHLNFALANAYDGLGERDKSFYYLEQGNHLRNNELNYNIADDKIVIAQSREIFGAGSLALDVAPDKDTSIHPLFIVGMPRSGTSLVEQILASHSQVYGAGELDTMSKHIYPILSNLSDQIVSPDNSEISQNDIIAVRDGYLEALAALNVSERIITDKLPLNFLFIGFILSAFPEAKIIHVNRDPRATCWSIYRHYFSGKGNGYAYDLGTLAEFYRLYIDLMAFWRERFPYSIYDLKYEKLTENQEQETHRLLQFCDLQWEEQCLDFHDNKRVVKTASNIQVRKKMYKGSSEAWKKYERHLQPLIRDLGYKD